MVETFYDVLDVDPEADEETITDAYRDRIKETHPDVSDAENAQERSKQVIEAKEVLTDTDERARYDRLGHDAYVERTSTDAGWSTGSAADASGVDWSSATDASGVDWSSATDASGVDWSSATDASGVDWSADDGASGSTWSGRGEWRDETASRGRSDRGSTDTGTDASDSSSREGGGDPASTGASVGSQTADAGTSIGGSGRGTTTNVGGPVGWATGTGNTVGDDGTRGGVHRSRLAPPTQSLVLLFSTFVCYPIMVFSSVFPSFPLIVNLVVGFCTLFLIAYLTSMPEVGVYVFGGWTAVATVGVIASAIDPFSLVGLLALGSTWFPFGLTVLTYRVLRW